MQFYIPNALDNRRKDFMKNDFSDTTIVLPTLNEIGNIKRIIEILLKDYRKVSIVVVDDGSVDGTLDIVRKMEKRNPRVRLLDRSRSRLHAHTVSVVEGAMLVKTRNTVVMDADFQHPVDKVGELVEGLEGHDLAIGVRTTVKDWGFYRRMVSMAAGNLAFLVFRIRGKATCSDMMSGFFAIRTGIFREMARRKGQGFLMPGCKILLDILKMLDERAKVLEVPYSTFHDRELGGSKLTSRRMLYTLEDIFR